MVRLVNISPARQTVSVDLEGAGTGHSSGVATVLASSNPDAENSPAEPTLVAPMEREMAGIRNKFQYEVEGNSFTVLKLKPEQR